MKVFPLLFLIILFLPSPVFAADPMDAGEKMISGGLTQWALDIANNMLLAGTGLKTGEMNNTEGYSGEQVLIFGIAAHKLDVFENPVVREAIDKSLPIFGRLAVFFLILITLFILLQIFAPGPAARITGIVNGSQTFYEPRDILEYVGYICLWFLGGPGLLWAELEINNYIVQGMMIDVLDQVALSSENFPLYFVMCFCYLVLLFFIAVRTVEIFYAASIWYLLGLVLAVKRTRWIGVLFFLYISSQIFLQAIIVSITTFVVKLVISGSLGWFSSTLIYGGMTLFLLGICFTLMFWPLIVRLLNPNAMRTIVYFARYTL